MYENTGCALTDNMVFDPKEWVADNNRNIKHDNKRAEFAKYENKKHIPTAKNIYIYNQIKYELQAIIFEFIEANKHLGFIDMVKDLENCANQDDYVSVEKRKEISQKTHEIYAKNRIKNIK